MAQYTELELKQARLAAVGTGRTPEQQAELARKQPGPPVRARRPGDSAPTARTSAPSAADELSAVERKQIALSGISEQRYLDARRAEVSKAGRFEEKPTRTEGEIMRKFGWTEPYLQKRRYEANRPHLVWEDLPRVDFDKSWDELQREMGEASTRGVRVVAEAAGLVLLPRSGAFGFDPRSIAELRSIGG